MCGIAGSADWVDEGLLDEMLETIRHRGPDSEGTIVDRQHDVMMGARRLSIVDIAEGDQPISNEDGDVHVVFNGELYNHEDIREDLSASGHSFESHCDTEVLVHLWEEYGRQMTDRIEGMFAFSLWDESSETVVLGRDRLGIKPLYYAETDDGLVWGSELPVLLCAGVDRTLSEKAVYNHFTLGYTPWRQTVVDSIKKLPPGNLLVSSPIGTEEHTYWSLDASRQQDPPSFEEASRRVRTMLERSVERRLMADVPVGAFLSGGLDSSSVVGLMSQLRDDPIQTFSLTFEDPEIDESEEARHVSEAFGTDHHEVPIDLSRMDLFGDLVEHFGEPTAELPTLPIFVLSEYASDHVKVVNTGEGADELFCGYASYSEIPRRYNLVARLPGIGLRMAEKLSQHAPMYGNHLRYLSGLRNTEEVVYNREIGFGIGSPPAHSYLDTDQNRHSSGVSQTIREAIATAPDDDPLTAMSAFELTHQLPDGVLYKTDQTSMSASLEARVPFLDHELVSYVASLPPSYKATPDGTKHVLKHAMRDVLPERILNREKFGMSAPTNPWFRSEHEAIATWFTEEKLERTPFVSSSDVLRLWDDHQRGAVNEGRTLWAYITFVAWYHKFVYPKTAIV